MLQKLQFNYYGQVRPSCEMTQFQHWPKSLQVKEQFSYLQSNMKQSFGQALLLLHDLFAISGPK